jgi:hypothetical protein
METRKVTVTVTRTYLKTATVEIDVPINIQDDELVDHLVESEKLDELVEEGIYQASLNAGDTEYQYSDPTNNTGGTL